MVYLGSGLSGPYVQQQMILILKSTQNRGLQQSVRERFGRGSIGADPRYHVADEVFLLVGEEEDDGRGEELSLQSSSCSVRTRMIYLESSSLSLRFDLPLYIEVGRVHGGLGEFSLWSMCAGVQEGLAAAWMDLGVVVEPNKP
jgi:hypothetical protein